MLFLLAMTPIPCHYCQATYLLTVTSATFFPFHPIFLCANTSPHFFFVVVGFLAFGIHGNVMTYSLSVCLPFACVPSSNLVVNKNVQSGCSAQCTCIQALLFWTTNTFALRGAGCKMRGWLSQANYRSVCNLNLNGTTTPLDGCSDHLCALLCYTLIAER